MRSRAICSSLQLFLVLALFLDVAKPDCDPIQDYCIADTKKQQEYFINGAPCMDPKFASSSHFATSALSEPGNTGGNVFGFNVTLANVNNMPGLNTMGLTMARIDIARDGIVPVHTHPRASEVTICIKGALVVGFVDTSKRVFTQQLSPGEAFVFPKGLMHFLYNPDHFKPALAVSGLTSQNPGAQFSSVAAFTSSPELPKEILERSFQINEQDVSKIRRNLGGWP